MSSKQTTVFLLGIALIALQFYAGGQWKILFGIIKKPLPAGTQATPGPKGGFGPGGHLIPGQLGPHGNRPL